MKGTFHRDAEVRAADDRQIDISIASGEIVERSFGREQLSMDPKHIDLSRVARGAVPFLVAHNVADQIGIVVPGSARVEGGKLRARIKFSRSARATEIWDDIQAGIRLSVSIGYEITKIVSERNDSTGKVLVVAYKLLEVSTISVPADSTVGVGRAHESHMENQTDQIRGEVLAEYRRSEADRLKIINQAAARYQGNGGVSQLAQRAIESGMTALEFREQLLALVENRNRPVASQPFGEGGSSGALGMNEQERRSFSITRAIRKVIEGKRDSFEFDVSDEYVRRSKLQTNGNFVVPPDVLMGERWLQRDQIVSTATLGGNLVPTILQAGSFVDMLRARLVTTRMGATLLDGLTGNVVIPRQTAGGAWTWVAETTASSETSVTYDQLTLTPLTLTGFIDYNRQLLLQSTPSVDELVRRDILNGQAVALDQAALHGAGGTAPTGLAGVSGIGAVTGGANGATVTWANIVNLEREVGIDSADMGSLGYVTNSQQRAQMKQILRDTAGGGHIWGDAPESGQGRVNGYRSLASQQVAANLSKGTSTTICSAIFFGNWSDLLIGLWGPIDVLVDQFSQSSSRVVRVVGTTFADVDCRHPESFSMMADCL